MPPHKKDTREDAKHGAHQEDSSENMSQGLNARRKEGTQKGQKSHREYARPNDFLHDTISPPSIPEFRLTFRPCANLRSRFRDGAHAPEPHTVCYLKCHA